MGMEAPERDLRAGDGDHAGGADGPLNEDRFGRGGGGGPAGRAAQSPDVV